MDSSKVIELLSDEKVVEALESKDHLVLAKFLGKEMCGFTEDDEKYVDLFWDAAFNKSWIYLSDEIIIDWMGYKKSPDTVTNFMKEMKNRYKINEDYKEVDKNNLLVVNYFQPLKITVGNRKKFYIITGTTLKKMLLRAQTKQGDNTCDYFIKVESLCNITNQLIFKYIEQSKDKQIKEMQHKVLTLTNYIHNEEKLVKDGWIYIATSKVYSAQNQYRLGRCETLNTRMQNYQVGRAKNDEMYYVFTYNCANSPLLEIIFRKLLKKYRDAPTKDMYVIPRQFLEKFMKEMCALYDKQIDVTNVLIDENLFNTTAALAPSPVKIPTAKASTTQKPLIVRASPQVAQATTQVEQEVDLKEVEQRILDNWSDDGYFLSMYDMLLYSNLQCRYNKDFRKSFKIKLETRSLLVANDVDDLGKDYCMIKQKVNGSAFYSNVPYLSVSGFNKYYNHKKTFKPERRKLQKIVDIMKEIEDPESDGD